MSNLSELLPAGGAGKNVDFVASGTLPNGKPVILKADGTVEVISGVAESLPTGTETTFNSASVLYVSVVYDPNNAGKFLIAYRDDGNSAYGTIIVGTISGSTFSFGSEYVFNSGQSNQISISFDSNTANKFAITWLDNTGDYGTACVGVISGTSVSFGTHAVYKSARTDYQKISYDPNEANKFVIVYQNQGNSSYGTAVVGTVSGTSISYGSDYVFNAGTTNHTSLSFDPNTAGKFVVIYQDGGNSNHGTAIIGTRSGTSISFGTEVVFNSSASIPLAVAYDPIVANKFITCYVNETNGDKGTAIVGTVSGTSISYGSAIIVNNASTDYIAMAFNPTGANFVIFYRDNVSPLHGEFIVGTYSGTTISFASAAVALTSYNAAYNAISFDPNTAGKFVMVWLDNDSSVGKCISAQLGQTNLTSTNFIGISDSAISSGATGKATIKGGIKTGLSSLTPNAIYYVQGDGTITTASASPAVRIGKALSSTAINLEYNS